MSKDDVAGEAYKHKQRVLAANRATDNRPAIERLYSAYRDLISEGWQDAMYAPRDGTEIEVIETGSTGIHRVAWYSFGHKPLDDCGCYFDDHTFPSKPVLWRPIKSKTKAA